MAGGVRDSNEAIGRESGTAGRFEPDRRGTWRGRDRPAEET